MKNLMQNISSVFIIEESKGRINARISNTRVLIWEQQFKKT